MSEYKRIPYHEAVEFLLPRHYLGRKPNIKYAYGCYDSDELKAVCTFGIPASASLCKGIAGVEMKAKVLELNRLCRVEDYTGQLSQFVAFCLNDLKKENLIIVSYSDTAMQHHGYIYQACNFMYTGATKERTDIYSVHHSRHAKKEAVEKIRKVRSSKHRYVYIAGDKRFKRYVLSIMKYPIYDYYPKGDNKNYELGNFLKDKLVDMQGRPVEIEKED